MIDFDKSSKQLMAVNFPKIVNDIIEQYEKLEESPSHWVQKDGIQNCWDARKNIKNKDKKWKCTIELHEKGDKKIVTITDVGTWGLTGKRLDNQEMLKDQPIEQRWCRFENYAFQNENTKDKHLLGSRGRGKFVFSGTSNSMITILCAMIMCIE